MKNRYNKQEFITECQSGGKVFSKKELKVSTGTANHPHIETGYFERTGGIQYYNKNAFMIKSMGKIKQIDFENILEVEIL